MNNYTPILDYLRKALDEKRYLHTLAVADTARLLGEHYRQSDEITQKLYLAGLLHDITKNLSTSEHIALCQSMNFALTEDDLTSPPVLHAISGALFAKEKFPALVDEIVYSAILRHTTGDADMTLFDKLIYLADYIEPTRKTPVCVKAREAFFEELARTDDPINTLNRHLLAITEATKRHLLENQYPLHRKTDAMIQFLIKELKR